MRQSSRALVTLWMLFLVLCGSASAANRVTTWAANQVLTSSALNGEFDNIYTGTVDRTAGRWGSNDDIRVTFGSAQDSWFEYDTGQTNDVLLLGLSMSDGGVLLVIDAADSATNFALATRTNPAIVIHSADATTANDYLELQHNQTDAVVNAGTGGVDVQIAGTRAFLVSNTTTIISAAGNRTIDLTGAATRTLTVTNSTASQVTNLDVDGNLVWRDGHATGTFTFAGTPTAARTITWQDASGTVYVSGGTDVTLADGGSNASLTAVNGAVVYSTATAFALTAAGTSGQILRSAGAASPTWSTATYPAVAGTASTLLRSDGTNFVNTTATFPSTGGTAGQWLRGDGTNVVYSTATLPATATGTGTILRADGTNWVATTATYPTTTPANELLYSTSSNVVGSSSALSYDGTTVVLNARWQNNSTSYHVVGSASADTGTQWLQTGSFTTSGTGAGWRLNSTLTGTAGNEMYGMWNNATLVEAGSGTHGVLAALRVSPTITAGGANVTDAVGIDVSSFAAAATTTNATGIRIAAPTGGTNNYAINVTSGDIYKAGTAYTNPAWVFEHHYTGTIERFADRFGARPTSTDPGYTGLPTLEETERFTREHFELPQMARFKKGGLADRGEMLLASVEENFLYDFQQNVRIKALEAEVAALKARVPTESRLIER